MRDAHTPRATLVVDVRTDRIGAESRVTALVDGVELWFSSRDVELTPAPEAFGSALLLPSVHRERPLDITHEASTLWADNIQKLLKIWSEWWGYRPMPANIRCRADSSRAGDKTALAFTCGVDSFYSLMTGPRPDLLVSVHGFDVPLADETRMAAFASSTEDVAASFGITSAIVRTNLREHPASGKRRLWDRSHGGGIAGIAHLLGDRVGKFTISSSYAARNTRPWGSTGDTDPLFSSDRVAIGHYGLDHAREEKIRLIANDPLVRRHLRVCWENRGATGNCSRCGKCLAAMLVLAEVGALDGFQVFEKARVLPERLDALPYLVNNINITQRIVDRRTLEPRLDAAARRLIARSRRAEMVRGYGQRLRGAIFPRG